MRLVVLRLGAVGDTLLAVPALLALRSWRPAARIGLIGRGDVGRLLLDCGAIDDLDDVDGPLARWLLGGGESAPPIAALPPSAAPDLAIVWRRHDALAVAERWRRLGAAETLCADALPSAGERRHVSDHLIGTLAPLGVRPPQHAVALRLSAETAAQGARLLENVGVQGPCFVLHPGSGGQAKCWPPEAFAVLARSLERRGRVVLLSGPADDAATAGVLAIGARAWPVLRDLSLVEVAGVLAAATAFVGNDSGPSHLAALVGCATVVLYGPTDPAVWGVRGPRARHVLPAGNDPAHWAAAPLAQITPAQVWEALRELGAV